MMDINWDEINAIFEKQTDYLFICDDSPDEYNRIEFLLDEAYDVGKSCFDSKLKLDDCLEIADEKMTEYLTIKYPALSEKGLSLIWHNAVFNLLY